MRIPEAEAAHVEPVLRAPAGRTAATRSAPAADRGRQQRLWIGRVMVRRSQGEAVPLRGRHAAAVCRHQATYPMRSPRSTAAMRAHPGQTLAFPGSRAALGEANTLRSQGAFGTTIACRTARLASRRRRCYVYENIDGSYHLLLVFETNAGILADQIDDWEAALWLASLINAELKRRGALL